MDVGDCFDHLDRVERKHAPLTPIADELSRDSRYVRVEHDSCSTEGCDGSLFRGGTSNELVCGTCSTVYNTDTASPSASGPSLWELFDQHRPRYRSSNRKRQVGGLPNHVWTDSATTGHDS